MEIAQVTRCPPVGCKYDVNAGPSPGLGPSQARPVGGSSAGSERIRSQTLRCARGGAAQDPKFHRSFTLKGGESVMSSHLGSAGFSKRGQEISISSAGFSKRGQEISISSDPALRPGGAAHLRSRTESIRILRCARGKQRRIRIQIQI